MVGIEGGFQKYFGGCKLMLNLLEATKSIVDEQNLHYFYLYYIDNRMGIKTLICCQIAHIWFSMYWGGCMQGKIANQAFIKETKGGGALENSWSYVMFLFLFI